MNFWWIIHEAWWYFLYRCIFLKGFIRSTSLNVWRFISSSRQKLKVYFFDELFSSSAIFLLLLFIPRALKRCFEMKTKTMGEWRTCWKRLLRANLKCKLMREVSIKRVDGKWTTVSITSTNGNYIYSFSYRFTRAMRSFILNSMSLNFSLNLTCL